MIVFVLIVCYPQIFLLQISVRNVNLIVSEENIALWGMISLKCLIRCK